MASFCNLTNSIITYFVANSRIFLAFVTSKVTTPQDVHGRLVLQVYLGLNTLEFSAILR